MTHRQFRTPSFLAALIALVCAPPADAQAEPEGWNSPAALDLVGRAIDRRAGEAVDTALLDYSAQARGYVYFLLDAPELDRQTLVRTDQVALEVYWRAPNQIRQRIVGLRDRRELPVTRLYYYLDRMTVVQDNYGEAIVIADGDNVSDVPHPVAAGALEVYDVRLADSLTLRLPGLEDPVRVREVQVRPKDPTRAAVVGSIFLEESNAALVRMAFTFTPAAYVDPRLDYIHVNLENGLWRGRFWLPYEQRLEIRRELPELDLPFGTVIRTRMRVGEYEFNQNLPDWLFASPHPITFLAEEERRAFPFEQPIDAELRMEGIGPSADVEEIREEARTMLRERALSGLPRGRLGIGSVSDVFRYNRAEGLVLGGGIGVRPAASSVVRLHGGWAFGAEHPVLSASLTAGTSANASVTAYLNRRLDTGQAETVSGLANSLGALFLADDWTDPFYASGVRGTYGTDLAGRSVAVHGSAERQRSAERTTTYSVFGSADEFRPVRPIEPGTRVALGLGVDLFSTRPEAGATARIEGTAARLIAQGPDAAFGRLEASAGYGHVGGAGGADFQGRLNTGILFGDAPVQELYLIGGRRTLPGFDYRAFAGDAFATMEASASRELLHPWLRGRASVGLGWTHLSSGALASAATWGVGATGGTKVSFGIGVGLFYDLLHIDVARGIGTGGETQVIAEIQPKFWDLL